MKTVSHNGIEADTVDLGGGPGLLPELAIYAVTDAVLNVAFVDNSSRAKAGSNTAGSVEPITMTAGDFKSLAYMNRSGSPTSKVRGIPNTAEGIIIKVVSGSVTYGGAGTPDGSDGAGNGIASGAVPIDGDFVSLALAGDVIAWGRVNIALIEGLRSRASATGLSPASQVASEENAVSTTALRVFGTSSWTGTAASARSGGTRMVSLSNKDAANDLYVNFFAAGDGSNAHATSSLGFILPPGATVFDVKVEPGMDVFVVRAAGSGRVWASERY